MPIKNSNLIYRLRDQKRTVYFEFEGLMSPSLVNDSENYPQTENDVGPK